MKLWLVVSFLFLLTFSACYAPSARPPDEYKVIPLEGTYCSQVVVEKAHCYYQLAILQENTTICSHLFGKIRNTCYKDIAVSTINIAPCQSIDTNILRAECILEVAKRDPHPEYCQSIDPQGIDKIQDIKNQCLSALAQEFANESYCEMMIQVDMASTLGSNRAFQKNDCFFQLAKSTNDPVLCEKMTGTEHDTCLLDFAKKMQSPDLCLKSGNPAECLASAGPSTLTCNDLPEKKRDWCWSSQSRSKKQIDLCGNIKDESLRSGCYADAAPTTNDPRYCLNITGSSWAWKQGECFMDFAVKRNDSSVCDFIDDNLIYPELDIHVKNDCIISVVSQTKNLADCDRIFDEKWFKGSETSMKLCRRLASGEP